MSAIPPIALSIIVPAYNEAATIADTLTKLAIYLQQRGEGYEVIVSADGTDGTREAALKFSAANPGFSVIGSAFRGGKGKAVRAGVLQAKGRLIGFIDADNKTPIEELAKLLPWFDRGCDIVIGSRKVGDANIQIAQPIYRRLGSRAFHFAMQSLVGLSGIRDTQCGFKFFTRAAARRVFELQKIDGYMFDVEVLCLAKRLGLSIQEVGVRWRDDHDSRYDPIRGTIRNARELWRIRKMQGVSRDRSFAQPAGQVELGAAFTRGAEL